MPELIYPVRIERLAKRPEHSFEYTVTGIDPFPTDMLRHDRCWPATEEDAARLRGACEQKVERHRAVKLNSYQEPRIGLWEKQGWKVI